MGKLIWVAKAITGGGLFVFLASYKPCMRIDQRLILKYCAKYDLEAKGTPDELVEIELANWFDQHKYLDRDHLIKLGRWKSPRALKQYKSELNTEERLKEITAFALSSKDEYIRIMCPQLIKGISWGVASVILHFAYPDDYMIIDFRAVWSLGLEEPKQYTFEYWIDYTNQVRKIAKECNITLRQLDKALWQYSKENQANV